MATIQLYLFPLTLIIIFPVGFVISYATAVHLGHIKAIFSYISDTGTIPPEQCYFSLFLFLSTIPYLGLIYTRFKQVEKIYKLKYNLDKSKLNLLAVVIGLISAFGLIIVASFQVKSNRVIHFFGAALTFVGGTIWLCIQSLFSFRLLPYFGSKGLAFCRVILGCAGIFMYLCFVSAGTIAIRQFNRSAGVDRLHWEQKHGGWEARGVSVVAEWLMLVLFEVYMITFVQEFKGIECTYPTLITIGIPEFQRNEEQTPIEEDFSENKTEMTVISEIDGRDDNNQNDGEIH